MLVQCLITIYLMLIEKLNVYNITEKSLFSAALSGFLTVDCISVSKID